MSKDYLKEYNQRMERLKKLRQEQGFKLEEFIKAGSQNHRKHYWRNTRWAILCGSLAVVIPYLLFIIFVQ